MSNITIIGDSLAYNRPDGLDNNLRWPALLKEKLPGYQINNLSLGSSTSDRFRKVGALLSDTDILIVQIGIVDCAPRLFTMLENKIIARLPSFISKRIIAQVKKKRTQSTNRSYVKPEIFERNLLELFNTFARKVVLYVKILPAGKRFVSLNPTIQSAITQYNAIIDKCAKDYKHVHLIDLKLNDIDDYTLEDGYHLNAKGHLLISELITAAV
ncbi:SGNH/GDSL hydrolase family protein [Mucilaginibacter flavidus]|uniref:SGNH/GDSL hydrolase family protein n=1 Tax=Mucilaginibacter flavidus TaxID=2949309 RepID=UPI0020921C55|nr:SGNH/GDSL hydrolase family protein [Mucilaginibacter flavidus]MCO5949298.1 SGNH/GDSL hydrolase family protein [Mucilaginibacter flavidus]